MTATSLDKARAHLAAEEYAEALVILEAMAEAGSPDAVADLGLIFQLGLGVPPDGNRAEALFLKAIESRVGVAAHNLATLYATGLPGFPSRPELSKHYYRLARSLGFQAAEDSFYE